MAGIKSFLYLTFGYPWEDKKLINETIDLIFLSQPDFFELQPLLHYASIQLHQLLRIQIEILWPRMECGLPMPFQLFDLYLLLSYVLVYIPDDQHLPIIVKVLCQSLM